MHENKFPVDKSAESDRAFVGWVYPSGMIRICVECSGDGAVDGETLLSFHEFSGVECGPSEIFAAAGKPSIVLFAGSFEDQKAIFAQWEAHAWENDRPNVFLDEGIAGLLKLGPAAKPPMPDIDAEGSAHFNEVLRVSRERMAGMDDGGEEPTLKSCLALAYAVDAELINYPAH